MAKNPKPPRTRSLLTTPTAGLASGLVLGWHPVLYLMIGSAAATLLLIGYVVVAPDGKEQPFRRVYALLCLLLNRGNEFGPPAPGPQRRTTADTQPATRTSADEPCTPPERSD